MRVGVLGPVTAEVDGAPVALGALKQRIVFAVLVCHANRTVSADRLIDAVWGAVPPRTAPENLRVYVYQLRRLLGGKDRIQSRPPGYALLLSPEESDAHRFELLAEQGRRALTEGDAEQAGQLLRQALRLWRGAAFEGLDPVGGIGEEAARLEERRLTAIEARIEADLATGQHAEIVTELLGLVAAHPLREKLCGQLLVALYRSGRRAEALNAYTGIRVRLAEEFGLDPGPELRGLHERILADDKGLVPVRSAPLPKPRQLPARAAHFTGRARDLAALAALPPGVPATIEGTAGVGKTALVVHFGHQVADRYPDGQLYVDLRGFDPLHPPLPPGEALGQFLRALGVDAEHLPIEVDEQAALYRSLLADKQILVVLDNAHSADQVRALLPGTPSCLVLVTSRNRLGWLVAHHGAHRVALDLLSEQESVALLASILGPQRVGAESGAAVELARLCGHLPLALRVAAANLANRPYHAIADTVRTLSSGNRFTALEIDGERQTAVAAAFDLSYRALEVMAQRLFRRLGLVPGPDFTPEAAAALAQISPREARELLDRLTGVHLLEQRVAHRYRMHDLVRAYALHLVDAAERDQALPRLLDWYLGTADTAARMLYPDVARLPCTPTSSTTLRTADRARAWLDDERANLVAATVQSPTHIAWELADALRGHFRLRGYHADWLATARAGLAAAELARNELAVAAMHHSLATAAQYGHEHRQQVVEHYNRALASYRQVGWQPGEASAMNNLGLVYLDLGQVDQAVDHCLRALASSRASASRGGEANALTNLGVVYRAMGRLDEAIAHHRQSLAIHAEIAAPYGKAVTLRQLGLACQDVGSHEEASRHLAEAQAIFTELGVPEA